MSASKTVKRFAKNPVLASLTGNKDCSSYLWIKLCHITIYRYFKLKDNSIATPLVESGLLFRMWECLIQVFHVSNLETFVFDVENDPAVSAACFPMELDVEHNLPDWTVLSLKGLLSVLTITNHAMLKVGGMFNYYCISRIVYKKFMLV